jgi:putative flippase GtrA
MENTTGVRITQKDYYFSIAAGLLIGLLLLPILKAADPGIYSKFAIVIVPFFLLATPIGLRIAFFIGQKIAIIYQIAKFGLIGMLNTLVDLGVLALITFIFRSYYNIESTTVIIGAITFYSIYKAASFVVANINSYFWNKYWTFDQGKKTQTRAEFVQFFAVSIVGFLINVFIASFVFKMVLASLTGLSDDQLGLIGAAAGSIAGLAWNFIGYKLWVFKK